MPPSGLFVNNQRVGFQLFFSSAVESSGTIGFLICLYSRGEGRERKIFTAVGSDNFAVDRVLDLVRSLVSIFRSLEKCVCFDNWAFHNSTMAKGSKFFDSGCL